MDALLDFSKRLKNSAFEKQVILIISLGVLILGGSLFSSVQSAAVNVVNVAVIKAIQTGSSAGGFFLTSANSILAKRPPKNPAYFRGLGRLQAHQGDLGGAVRSWEQIDGQPSPYLLHWGNFIFHQGETKRGLAWLEAAVELDPGCGDCWYFLALAYEKLQRPVEAVGAYDQAVTGTRNLIHMGDILVARSALILEEPHFSDDKLVSLLNDLDKAIQENQFRNQDWSTRAHLLKGNILRRLGRMNGALQEYFLVLEARPQDYWANLYAGNLLWNLEGDLIAAETLLKRAIQINQQRAAAYQSLSQIYREEGLMEKSLEIDRMAAQNIVQE